MSLPVVDCRNLIQFCRAFHIHNTTTAAAAAPANSPNNSSSSSPSYRPRANRSVNPFSNDFCHRSPTFFALDLLILLSVIASLAFLFLPHFRFFFLHLLPLIHRFILDLILDAPLPYFIGFLLALLGLILTMLIDVRLRKCGNPRCKGLRRAVEYDIQLETEQCVKHSPPSLNAFHGSHGLMQLELGQDRKELEAELKKMAPLNGRTVLIFRARCGCPAGRLEVWGPKRIRRIKK